MIVVSGLGGTVEQANKQVLQTSFNTVISLYRRGTGIRKLGGSNRRVGYKMNQGRLKCEGSSHNLLQVAVGIGEHGRAEKIRRTLHFWRGQSAVESSNPLPETRNSNPIQGYLAHKKERPPRTVQ